MALASIYKIEKTTSISKSHTWQGWAEALQHFATNSNAWIVATLHYGVFVGKVNNGKIEWLTDDGKEDAAATGLPRLHADGFPDENQIAELRIFDANKEVYFWKDGNELRGRIRQDGAEGNDVSYTQTNLYTRGVVARKLFDDLNTKAGVPIYINTRNYIGQNAIGQSGYVDCRFVEFKK